MRLSVCFSLYLHAMQRFFKNQHLIFLSIFLTLFFAGVYSVSARISPNSAMAVRKQQALGPTELLQHMLTVRIAQYQAFASTSISSLPKNDRDVLNSDIQSSIVRMQMALDAISSSTLSEKNLSNTGLTEVDTLLNMKIVILATLFKPSTKDIHASRVVSTSTQKLNSFNPVIALRSPMASSTISKNIARPVTFVFSKTTSVKAVILHNLITATSVKDIVDIQNALLGKVQQKKTSIDKKISEPQKSEPIDMAPVENAQEASATVNSGASDDVGTTTSNEATQTIEQSTVSTTTEQAVQPEVSVDDSGEVASSTPVTN